MSVCLSSRRYSGVISERDSISSPDLIVCSNSAAVGMASILGQMKAGKIWCPGRIQRAPGPKRGGYSSAWLEHQIVDLGVAGSNPASHPSNSVQVRLLGDKTPSAAARQTFGRFATATSVHTRHCRLPIILSLG